MFIAGALILTALAPAQTAPVSPNPASVCAQSATDGQDVAELCLAQEAARAAERLAKDDVRRTRQLESAVEHARRAASVTTKADAKRRAVDMLSQCYDAQHLDQPGLEESALRELIALGPRDLAPVSRLAKLQESLGLIDAAEDTLLGARHQQPDEVEPYRMLAQFYARRAGAVRKPGDSQKPASPPAPGEPDENGVYRVGGGIEAPKRADVAQYPAEASAAGIQGVVIVEVVIDEGGNVSDTKVLRSIPLLDEPAVSAVRNWRFTPTVVNGQPVKVKMVVTQNFTLK